MEKNKILEVKKWLELSKEDLESSEILYKNKKFSQSVYYAQQSSEKCVKSLLILFDEQIYEHKVSSIFYDKVFPKFPQEEIENIYENLTELEKHWLKSRYILKNRENKLIEPKDFYNSSNSKKLIEKSKEVFFEVKNFLEKEFNLKFQL